MAIEIVLEENSAYESTSPPNYDALWKKIIEELFKEFMQFFAPDLYEEIDFTKEPEFKKQELRQQLTTLKGSGL